MQSPLVETLVEILVETESAPGWPDRLSETQWRFPWKILLYNLLPVTGWATNEHLEGARRALV
jgi:hypothetical protein